MMRVVLELLSGPQTGRQVQLLKNQRIKVGSTSWADFIVRDDSTLAGQHFTIETDHQICRMKNLTAEGETLVNGNPMQVGVLRNGDQISAGRSKFVVHVEGDAAEIPQELQAELKAAAPVVRKPMKKPTDATFTVIVCDTGVTRYEGSCKSLPPAELAAGLAAHFPLFLIADNRRVQSAALAELKEPKYLFDWMGEHAAGNSPLIVVPGELADPLPVIEQGWRKDGVICLFTKEPAEAFVAKLRGSARAEGDRVLGICWPSVLGYLLSHYQADFVQEFLGGMGAVLLEDPKLADVWAVYVPKRSDELLQKLGLRADTPTK